MKLQKYTPDIEATGESYPIRAYDPVMRSSSIGEYVKIQDIKKRLEEALNNAYGALMENRITGGVGMDVLTTDLNAVMKELEG